MEYFETKNLFTECEISALLVIYSVTLCAKASKYNRQFCVTNGGGGRGSINHQIGVTPGDNGPLDS